MLGHRPDDCSHPTACSPVAMMSQRMRQPYLLCGCRLVFTHYIRVVCKIGHHPLALGLSSQTALKHTGVRAYSKHSQSESLGKQWRHLRFPQNCRFLSSQDLETLYWGFIPSTYCITAIIFLEKRGRKGCILLCEMYFFPTCASSKKILKATT